jgi:soluble lytic murein transglycosylase-like protein
MMKLLFILLVSAAINIATAQMIDKKYRAIIKTSVKKYPYVNKNGKKVTMSPALVKAVIYQESRGNPDAKSKAGAY